MTKKELLARIVALEATVAMLQAQVAAQRALAPAPLPGTLWNPQPYSPRWAPINPPIPFEITCTRDTS